MIEGLGSLLAIATVAAVVPLIVGLFNIRVADVVLLLGGGILFGPELLGFITVDAPIELLYELGLGMLFFMAGLELHPASITGKGGRLAATGWFISLALALSVGGVLAFGTVSLDTLGFSIALTSTALGTLLPVLRDSGELGTRFGRLFMGAGAWGELGPIVAIAILLGTKSKFAAILTLAVFGLIALALVWVPARLATQRVRAVFERGHHTSAQTAVRFTMLLLIGLLAISGSFGLDVVLGAFAAGLIVRRLAPPSENSLLMTRIEAIAFGFLVPIFFVVSGANLDVRAIVDSPGGLAIAFLLLLLVRGVPQYFLYRDAIPDRRERARFALLVATGLPIIVAVTSLEVAQGLMTPQIAAILVGAGALSVLVFPLVGNWLVRGQSPLAQERAANTD